MVRLLYSLGVLAILSACGILGHCIWQWSAENSQREDTYIASSALEVFRERVGDSRQGAGEATSLLVKQAEIFSAHLTSAAPVPKKEPGVPTIDVTGPVPAIRPPAPSVQFKLVGTSYYPNQPKRSMALICDLVASESEQRWVKEGAQVGHFIVQEIRHGAIVYRDGDNLREMAVESGVSMPSLVRDTHLGDRKVSAAVNSTDVVSSMSPGPNNVEIVGGN